MKTLHVFNFLLWIIGAGIGIAQQNLGFTMYEVSGAVFASVLWWLEP